MSTAPTLRSQLAIRNRRYLTLKVEIERAKARFRYPAEAIHEATELRNEIVELQNRLKQADREVVIMND